MNTYRALMVLSDLSGGAIPLGGTFLAEPDDPRVKNGRAVLVETPAPEALPADLAMVLAAADAAEPAPAPKPRKPRAPRKPKATNDGPVDV